MFFKYSMVPGNLYILTAPSGAGKTTLAHQLVASMEGMRLSISYTTRPPRSGEISGKDYFFIDYDTFEQMLVRGDFLEYAKVHSYLYGTSLDQVNSNTAAGIDTVLAIDWQGAEKIREAWQSAEKLGRIQGKVISIFILPPSKEILQQRLHLRGQDDEQVIQNRLEAAKGEVAHYRDFDYLIINDVLEEALADIQTIVRASRLSADIQDLKHEKLLMQWFS